MKKMREYLYRAIRVESKKWSYGVPLQHCDGDWQMISGKVGAMIIDTIIPETIGQYTGLTDKNGVKIFEGDIVRYGDTVHKVVFEQRNGTAYFGLVYSDMETCSFGYYQDLRQIEVIAT